MFDYDGKSFDERNSKQLDQHVLEMKKFMDWFEKRTKLTIYLIYGTLLGAVRESDFLKHDYDIDLAYLSKETEINKIVEEKNRVLEILKEADLLIKSFGYGHFHTYSFDKSMALDMWTSWIDQNNNFYAVSAYDAWVKKEDIEPFTKIKLRGIDFTVPKDYDKFLTVYYGNWKIPQKTWQQSTKFVGLPISEKYERKF